MQKHKKDSMRYSKLKGNSKLIPGSWATKKVHNLIKRYLSVMMIEIKVSERSLTRLLLVRKNIVLCVRIIVDDRMCRYSGYGGCECRIF